MQNLCIQYRKWMCEFGPRSILLIITSGYVTPNKEQWQMIKVKKKKNTTVEGTKFYNV